MEVVYNSHGKLDRPMSYLPIDTEETEALIPNQLKKRKIIEMLRTFWEKSS